jgi:serine-type D-Ala-D-Ala carboxypeptidase/endopeptidase
MALSLAVPVLALGAADGTSASVAKHSAPTATATSRSKLVVTSAAVGRAVDAVDREFATNNFVPGMAIAVVSPTDSGTLRTRIYTFGYANLATRTPVSAQTQFEIGSETKVFTAVLLANALANTPLKESDSLQSHLPGVRVPMATATASCAQPITIADLATHNSGLRRDPANFPGNGTPAARADYTPAMLLHALETTQLDDCPGTTWIYSNFAFGVLGLVLSREDGGVSFAHLISTQITGPLGMPATMLETQTKELATGYLTRCDAAGSPPCVAPPPHPVCPCFARERAVGAHVRAASSGQLMGIVGSPWYNDGALAPGGGLISSITDMATFVRAELGEGPPPTIAAVRVTQQPVPGATGGTNMQMGLGWQVYSSSAGNYLLKNGGTLDMDSATVIIPAADVGVTVLSNGPVNATGVPEHIIQRLFGIPPPSQSGADTG